MMSFSKVADTVATSTSRLNTLASNLLSHPPSKIELTPKRLRILFNKKFVADSTASRLVWEHPYYPLYYVPSKDVQMKYVEKVQKTESGEGFICRLVVGERRAGNVLLFEKGVLEGLVRFEFKEMGLSPF